MAKSFKRMTASSFAQIKALIAAGVKPGQIKKAIGRSNNVVNMVKRSKDFKDYTRLNGELYLKYGKSNKNGELKSNQSTVSDSSTSGLLQSILAEMRDINKNLSKRKFIL